MTLSADQCHRFRNDNRRAQEQYSLRQWHMTYTYRIFHALFRGWMALGHGIISAVVFVGRALLWVAKMLGLTALATLLLASLAIVRKPKVQSAMAACGINFALVASSLAV